MKRKYVFLLIYIFVCLVLLNVFVLYLVDSYMNPLQRAKRILTLDEKFGWKVKGDLHTLFESKDVHTDKIGFRFFESTVSPANATIVLLGPSSAFGWGVSDDETYANLLRNRIGLHAKLINASQIGYSTEQGLLLRQSLHLPQAKSVIISYGINDLDRFRFFDNIFEDDKTFFSTKGNYTITEKVLNSFALGRLLMELRAQIDFYVKCGASRVPPQRVSSTEFENNIKKLILSFPPNTQIYLVATPFQIPDDYKTRNPNRFVMIETLYKDAVSAYESGDCAESRAKFLEARSQDPYAIEAVLPKINDILQKMDDGVRIHFVDIYKVFKEASSNLYYDPVHPNEEGHRLISEMIYESMKRYGY